MCGGKKQSAEKDNEALKVLVQDIAENLGQQRCKDSACADLLIVDDNEFNRYLLVQLLTKYNFRCSTVRSNRKW